MASETYHFNEARHELTENNRSFDKFMETLKRIPEFFQNSERRRAVLRAEIEKLKTPKKEALLERLIENDSRAKRKMLLASGLFALIGVVVGSRNNETHGATAQIPERLAPNIIRLAKQTPSESFDWADDLSSSERSNLTQTVRTLNKIVPQNQAESSNEPELSPEMEELLANDFREKFIIGKSIIDFIDYLCTDKGFCETFPADLFNELINDTGAELGLDVPELEMRMRNELLNKAFILERRQAKTLKDHRLIGMIYEATNNNKKALENYTVGNDSDSIRKLLSKRLIRSRQDDSAPLLGIEFDNEHDMTMDTTNLQNALALADKENSGFGFTYINTLLAKIDAILAEALASNLPETQINIIKLRRAQIESDFISYLVPPD